MVVETAGFQPGYLNTPVPNSDKLTVAEKFSLDTAKMALTRSYSSGRPRVLEGKVHRVRHRVHRRRDFNPGKCQELNYIDYSKSQKS